MTRIQGVPRDQVEFGCLNDAVGKENPVRVMDAFVEELDFEKLGFVLKVEKIAGRPSFEERVFFENLPLWLYQWYSEQQKT